MICPSCHKNKDRVVDSRATDGGLVIRRRRECLLCHERFTTYERVSQNQKLTVVKKDGSRVPFNPENILKGVQAACGKRPIPEAAKAALVQTIDEEIHHEFDREVPSTEIGRRVATRLREIDEIAYIRYASEYHEFRNLEQLSEELSDLKARVRKLPNQRDLFPVEES